mmetsp:Transcript_32787/g.44404  ORF Transcript_32787/g.44404 Transcript_32787/m.44404 type:complete len:248 (-) Transcript_32787:841-1584(-)
MNPCATDTSASLGHGRNQSIVGPEISPGNFRARSGNLGFSGDMQSMMCRLSRTQSMKYCLRLSWDSASPGRSLMNEAWRSAVIAIISSLAKSPGTSPVIMTELMTSRNTSSLISASVNTNTVGCRMCPAFLYMSAKSSLNEARLYVFVRVTWNIFARLMYAESFVSDCFPDPPTPTKRPDPRGISVRRLIRRRCCSASSKRTSSIFFDGFSSLYLSRKDSTRSRTFGRVPPGSYTLGASSIMTPSSS